MNGIEFITHLLWGIICALVIGVGAWALGTGFHKMLKSKTALIVIRILAILILVLAAFVYFPKWFGANN